MAYYPPKRKKVYSDPNFRYDTDFTGMSKMGNSNDDVNIPYPVSSKREKMIVNPELIQGTRAIGKQVGAVSTEGSSPLQPPAMQNGLKNVFSKFGDIVPYISNLANSFKRAPLPNTPQSVDYITPTRVHGDAQLGEVDRNVIAQNSAADRNLDENTAAAVKTSNMAQGIRAKNSVHEWEDNTNANLSMNNKQTNTNINAMNVGIRNNYNRDLVDANIANQREQSANVSNAADKYIGQQQFKDAQELDKSKWNAYLPLWNQSGVANRAYPRYGAGGELDLGDKNPPVRKRITAGYSGIQTDKGENLNPTSDQWIINMGEYMKKNNPNSNIYRDRFQHYSGYTSKPVTTAAHGGMIGRKKVYC